MNIRLVKQKINDIKYDYKKINNKIENLMREGKIIDLGENKFDICGLFNITLDIVPDIIERKTVVSVIVGIFEELNFLELSNKNLRLKLNISQIEDSKIPPVKKIKNNKDLLLNFIKDFYDEKIEKNLKGIDIDDHIFSYIVLLIISILEDSSIIILGHLFSFECIQLEGELEESKSKSILIDMLANSIK